MSPDAPSAEASTSDSTPIFIHGILPRSGTNYLFDLIRQHPDCEPAVPVWEDFFLAHADRLSGYVEAVSDHWNPDWGLGHVDRDELYRRLGDGILAFLRNRCDGRRLVAKTPSVENLALFPRLFPDARLLILVRDGRAVVESGVKSFGWSLEWAIHSWDTAARTVLRFDREHRDWSFGYRIVRYEDLVGDPEPSLRTIFEFLHLDCSRYDFDAARDAPVRGSSNLREGGQVTLHWRPLEKSADFDPIRRFAHWDRAPRARFDWIAGDASRQLGYATDVPSGAFWGAYNALLDARWLARSRLKPVLAKLSGRVRRQRRGSAGSRR